LPGGRFLRGSPGDQAGTEKGNPKDVFHKIIRFILSH
jgi:hypothetical protein